VQRSYHRRWMVFRKGSPCREAQRMRCFQLPRKTLEGCATCRSRIGAWTLTPIACDRIPSRPWRPTRCRGGFGDSNFGQEQAQHHSAGSTLTDHTQQLRSRVDEAPVMCIAVIARESESNCEYLRRGRKRAEKDSKQVAIENISR